ncbi:MAG: glycosyltransferase [Nitrospira sp.]|nr:glycosyltransferase [Nitrospira sp.]
MARVSVVIPTYNRFPHLCRAVDSVLKQTYRDSEIIVVDDGSTDETPQTFSKLYPQVNYHYSQHSGLPAVARNVGVRAATGEYVAFLDSDDQWLPEKLAQQIAIMDEQPAAGLVCSNAFVINNDDDRTNNLYLQAHQGKSGRVLEELFEDNFVIASTAIVRRSILDQVGLFAEQRALRAVEDYDLWLRIAIVSEAVFIPHALAVYRDAPSKSVRANRSESNYWRVRHLIIKRVRQALEAQNAMALLPGDRLSTEENLSGNFYLKALWSERRYLNAIPQLARLWMKDPRQVSCAIGRRLQHAVDRVRQQRFNTICGDGAYHGATNGIKLHLGCGEVYLQGYVNIDFPPSRHSVQRASIADIHADILRLVYPDASVEEIRLHHVFEHFERPVALRLLIEWYAWLKEGGQLVIETPDFHRCVQEYLRSDALGDQMKIVRHLFGSHEASWAVHYDGWYRKRFEHVLTALGYQDLEFTTGEWQGTYNITATGKKGSPPMSKSEQMREAKILLGLSLVNESPTETRMLQAWMEQFENNAGDIREDNDGMLNKC